jgi:type I restriction enzyme M protein
MASQANSGSDLGFEADLFRAADKLRGNLEPSEYKHVALGLIFLKYISEAFAAHYVRLGEEEFADQEDPEEYLAANVFWVPPEARWGHLQANAKLPKIKFTDVNTGKEREGDIGNLIDNAMDAIEKANAAVLKDVLPKDYSTLTHSRQPSALNRSIIALALSARFFPQLKATARPQMPQKDELLPRHQSPVAGGC